MQTIDDVDLEGKRVLLRTDLNLPIEKGEPRKTVRFDRYRGTVEELAEEGAKTVIVAHQGRPARQDFLSLEQHSQILAEALEREVEFIPSFFGPELGEKVARMDSGEIAMLENIRFLSEELQNAPSDVHGHDFFVQKISQYFDLFVDDAFSTAHRSHGSMVGFTETLESCAGPIMQREVESCSRVREEFENGLMVLGGEKPSDLIGIMEEMIDDVEKVLLGGIPGELALKIEGFDLGEKSDWIEDQSFSSREEELEELLEEHGEKIIPPEDVKTESGDYEVGNVPDDEMTWDIGEETTRKFISEIREADDILMKGPMGAFEDYPEGTRKVVDAIAESDAFTVLGGGHTSSLVQRFDRDFDDFSHVSIAGGAFVRFMSGEELPAVQVLKKNS